MHRPVRKILWPFPLVMLVSFLGWGQLVGLRGELMVTEIHYHSDFESDANASDPLEFIEIHNPVPDEIALTGYRFTNGIQYQFPDGSKLGPSRFAVIAKDTSAFSNFYKFTPNFGPYEGQLSNSGESIAIENSAGETIWRIRYQSIGDWPAAADGTGHTMVFEDLSEPVNRGRNWRASREKGGSPGSWDIPPNSTGSELRLVDKGSEMHYFKGTREPSQGSTSWTTPGYAPDQNWIAAKSGIGYSSDPQELVEVTTVLNDMPGRYLSVYTRHAFPLTATEMEQSEKLLLRLQYDDGYVVYLNGTRVAAANIPGSPPAFNQQATTGSDYPPVDIDLTPHLGRLIAGVNILAIQGHNVGISNSSDFVIAPRLTLQLSPKANTDQPWRNLVINEISASSTTVVDFVELFNPTDAPIDISGFLISDSSSNLDKFTLPGGTIVPANGFYSLSAEDMGFSLSSAGEKFFLVFPSPQTVACGYAWGTQWPEVGLSRFPDGNQNWFYSTAPSPGASNSPSRFLPAVINEIHYHHPDGERFEFLEIANLSADVPLDISNWHFIGIDYQFPAGASIPALGFGVIADDRTSAVSRYEIPGGTFLDSYSGGLRDGGELLVLMDGSDIVMDMVEFNNQSPWPLTPDGLGASLERTCIESIPSTWTDWTASQRQHPSPGRNNRLTGCVPHETPSVKISEVFYNPSVKDEDGRALEFVEIVNSGASEVSLDGWALVGDIFYEFPNGQTMQPDARLIVAWDPLRCREYFTLPQDRVLGGYSSEIPNGGGNITVVQSEGLIVDSVQFNDDFPWPSTADADSTIPVPGLSLSRLTHDQDGSGPTSWIAAIPNPLQPTPEPAFNTIGCIQNLSISPEFITSSTKPVLTIGFSKNFPPENVAIEYFAEDLDRDDKPLRTGTATKISESTWTFEFPQFPPSTVVRYAVRAEIAEAGTWRSPDPQRDQFPWHGWFVDPESPTNAPTQVHLFISSDNWRLLHNYTRPGRVTGNSPNPNWDREVPAIFVADGTIFDVMVRHQGSRWGRNNGGQINFECSSPENDGTALTRSWRIDFPGYRRFQGRDVLTLQKQSGWPQKISFRLFQQAGVPAPDTTWMDLRINGCPYNSRAFAIERPGSDLVERWFGEVGDLFKSQGFTGDEGPWSWGDERLIVGALNGFTKAQRYKYTYDRVTHKYKSSLENIIPDMPQRMIEDLHVARGKGKEALRQFLTENFDINLTLRYICVINYVGTFDDMFQNHYIYRRADNGLWCMFPWDMDNTLGGAFGEADAHPFRGVDESRYGSVGNRSGWWNRIKDSFFIAFPDEFMQVFFHLNNSVLAPGNLRSLVQDAAAEYGSPGAANSTLNHIQARHNYLNQFLAPRLASTPPQLHISSSDTRITLSWSGDGVQSVLESATSPRGPWSPLVEKSEFDGFHFQTSVRPDSQAQFFRLKSQ